MRATHFPHLSFGLSLAVSAAHWSRSDSGAFVAVGRFGPAAWIKVRRSRSARRWRVFFGGV